MSRNCYYHPDNQLHNFCVNKQCALPLCPKCINIHLNQSQKTHHIQSLSETRQMISQQLSISIQALQHNLKSIQSEQYTPEFCFKEYSEIIQKYQQQAINAINEHYSYVKRQLFEEIKSKYTCHLSNLSRPLQENLIQLQKLQKGLNQKPIESMIKIVSQQIILHIEKFLQKISEKKNAFKMELPRLEGIDGNRLRIVPGGIETKLKQNYKQQQKSIQHSRSLNRTSRFYNDVQDYNKINMLQAQLYGLRNEYY